MLFPWKQMEDGKVWFQHEDCDARPPRLHLEKVTLHPTFGLHYMRAMREAGQVKGTNRLGKYGHRLNPKGFRFWLESKYYGQSIARLKWRHRNGLSSVSHDVKQSMGMAEYPS